MSDLSERIAIVAFAMILVVSASVSYIFRDDAVLVDYGLIILLITVLNILAGIVTVLYLIIRRNRPYDPLDSILDSDAGEKRFRPSL